VSSVGASSGAPQVAVIGGGYAGMAAAVTLAGQGIACRVFEAGKVLGGRARRIPAHDNTLLDNGQHILVGAYRELLRLMQLVGTPASAVARHPLTLRLHPAFSLRAPNLPAPWHLAWALLAARGLSLQDKFAALRLCQALKRCAFQVSPDMSVAQLFAQHRQTARVTQLLWEPLCLAALNTPIARASAQVFAHVVRDTLFQSSADSDLILPRIDLSALFPEPAARWLVARGSQVETSQRIDRIAHEGGAFRIATQHGTTFACDAVICAVAPHQLEVLALPVALAPPDFKYEPIFTVYLRYPQRIELPFPMTGCVQGLVQWLFDRDALCASTGVIAAVISASGGHQAQEHAHLAQRVHDELQELTGALPDPLWHKVIAEKFATFACEPNLQRPGAQTALDGFYLAGDYTASEYPATLEGAVRSGIRAAQLAHRFLTTRLL
jgi:squalene-associated FAD-dependent desaturase